MQKLNVPDADGRILVIATIEEIHQMVAARYQEKTKQELPPHWKLKIIMSEKSELTIGDKELKG